MNPKLLRRLNPTYQKLTRNRHLTALYLHLTDEQYRLWDLYLALFDWDQKHVDTYQTVDATDRDLAQFLSCSPSKVCRARKGLLRKGCLTHVKRSIYKVITPQELAGMKHETARVQDEISSVQQEVAGMQQNRGSRYPNTIVSYKDKNKDDYKGFSPEPHGQINTLGRPQSFSSLEEDDIRWINENLGDLD